jgi:hypothetical protein
VAAVYHVTHENAVLLLQVFSYTICPGRDVSRECIASHMEILWTATAVNWQDNGKIPLQPFSMFFSG